MRYIITETKISESFDPLDGDKTANLPVMRMLYATPIETNEKNELTSQVLSRFSYSADRREATFEVKTGLTYADGKLLTPYDIVFSVARMAYHRPTFPVLKDIEGVPTWAAEKNGLKSLPTGIAIDGNIITIRFTREHANPLFRFCLELFSIIPASCIDLKTTKLICPEPPASGYFVIKSRSKDSILFRRRPLEARENNEVRFPEIEFVYMSLRDVCSRKIQENEVVATTEFDFLVAGCNKQLSPTQVHWMPSSRFVFLRFNPQMKLFETAESRQLFSEVVRNALTEKGIGLRVERGLIPRLLPGYLDSDQFQVPHLSGVDRFVGHKLLLPKVKGLGLSIIYDAIADGCKKVGMVVSYGPDESPEEMVDGFIAGTYPVAVSASGFWAQDPVGDLSMLFTKNLHRVLSFLWNDSEMYKNISELEAEINPVLIKSLMEKFNRHIYDQSLIAPVSHFRRLYISADTTEKLDIPQAITSPAPWQFRVSR